MALESFCKFAFFIVFFSFAYIMTAYRKKARARNEDRTTRIKMHDQHEVPLLLRLRQSFGIPFYLGVLVWTFVRRSMAWSSLSLPTWLRCAGLAFGIFAIVINAWRHKTLSRRLGEDFDPALRLLEVPALVKVPIPGSVTRATWHFCCCRSRCFC